MTALIIVIVVIVVITIITLAWAYNGLVRGRTRCDAAWAQIDVQLTRRYDLIPNLVETVQGYAAHERVLFESVTRARADAMGMTGQKSPQRQAGAENALTGTLRSLFAVSEAYPDLKANQNFLALQEELTATEDRVAFARQFYNDAVEQFNARIQTVPRNLIAGRLHFAAREYFEAARGRPTRSRWPSEPMTERRDLVAQIGANKRRTIYIMAGFLLFVVVVTAVFDLAFAGGPYLAGAAVVVALVLVWSGYFYSDRVAIAAAHAYPADPGEYRQLHNLVEGLCIGAGIPKPRVFIVDDPAPNAFATGRNPDHAAVAVTTGLLAIMNRPQLEGVLSP